MISNHPVIGFIGFGEVAYHMSEGLRGEGVRQVLAYARNAWKPGEGDDIHRRARKVGVELTRTLAELVTRSEIVISAVFGHVALEIAKESAPFMAPGRLYVDLNNAPPSSKERGEEMINARGAGFVDVGLFETPASAKHKAFMYASGDGAERFKTAMSPYGMNVEVVPGKAGRATTFKTLANIYMKGLQAICLELALSSLRAGIDPDLLASLVVRPVSTLPRNMEMAFWIIRGALSASRKTSELRSVAETIWEWGVDPIMVEAAIKRLDSIARYDLRDHFKTGCSLDNYKSLLETVDRMDKEKGMEWK